VTDEELVDLISSLRRLRSEIAGVEVKRAREKVPSSLVETLSSFSNTPGGGVVLLGLDEQSGFTATGVADPHTMQAKVAGLCADAMEPPIRPYIQIHQVEDVAIISVEVPELDVSQKPCFYKGAGQANGSYRRVGDSDQRMTSYEVQQLIAARGQPEDDLAPVSGATMEDLNPVQVEAFMARLRRSRPSYADEATETALRRMRVLVPDADTGDPVPSLAGLLALGRHPQDLLPQLNVTFVHYPDPEGASAQTRFVDNRSLDGSIPEMVQAAMQSLRANMRRRAIVRGAGREDVWEYPEPALREAIVNALVHRDYSPFARGTQVQIEMYPDRLVIRNPGGLFGAVTPERLGSPGVCSSRNAALLRILEDVVLPEDGRPICENRGSGLHVMVRALEAAGISPPDFTDHLSHFEVVFPNHTLMDDDALTWLRTLDRDGLSDTQAFALVLMRNGLVFTNADYRARFLLDSRVATQELSDLVRRGLIQQEGTGRWTSYRLVAYAESNAGGPMGSAQTGPLAVLQVLANHEPLNRREIATRLGNSDRNVLAWIKRLREASPPLIVRHGAERSPRATYGLTEAGRTVAQHRRLPWESPT
jgi:ATP-dependent DNA helicase RecG